MGYLSRWSHCNGLPAQWKKYEDFLGWSHCNGLPAQWKNTRIFFSKEDMIRLEGIAFNRWKPEGNEGSETLSKGNEGSKAHSKGGRVGNALPLMVGVQRRTPKEVG
jgi:hypothetical protein